jgi:hypothetical protein
MSPSVDNLVKGIAAARTLNVSVSQVTVTNPTQRTRNLPPQLPSAPKDQPSA